MDGGTDKPEWQNVNNCWIWVMDTWDLLYYSVLFVYI